MAFYPQSIPSVNQVAPAPRRVRGIAGGHVVFDTTKALYVWEWPHYPQYYLPQNDVDMSVLSATGDADATQQGTVRECDLRVGTQTRAKAARLVIDSPVEGLAGTVRFDWEALDQWFEEDEEVFVHPRDPYSRVDALRSRRRVRIELNGSVLTDSPGPVFVFETGLPTRYYVDPSDVRFEYLVPSETRTACPYKGRTTSYWSVNAGGTTYEDVAWSYAFPTRQLLPIAGLIAFLNEKVDVFIDDEKQERPLTHMT
ncbi:MAG: DUF427 domain-containing protein [Candidatus Eremiobacteraeota bacterium]|nr:DUF427 domain-containing protein [Candidatus Eremiobacteraeota bacterium]